MEGKTYELHYFNLNCRAIIIRMLLKFGKVDFKDNQYTFDEWPALKPNFEFKNLPVLVVNGTPLHQSYSLWIYLARLAGGLLGRNADEEQNILACVFTFEDIEVKVIDLEIKRVEEKVAIEALPQMVEKICAGLEIAYKRNGAGKYWVGDRLSLADFYLVSLFGVYIFQKHKDTLKPLVEKTAPKLYELILKLRNEEVLSKLIEQVEVKHDHVF